MKYTIETPRVPNFVRINIEGGAPAVTMVALATLTDDDMNTIIEDWKADLYENRQRQKQNGMSESTQHDNKET